MISDEDPEQNDEETYKEDFIPNAESVVPEQNAQPYVQPLHSSSRAETSYSARSLFDESTESFEEETFSDNFHDSSQQNVSIEQEDLSYEAASGDKQQTAAAVELI